MGSWGRGCNKKGKKEGRKEHRKDTCRQRLEQPRGWTRIPNLTASPTVQTLPNPKFYNCPPMIRENRQLVTGEPVEFEK